MFIRSARVFQDICSPLLFCIISEPIDRHSNVRDGLVMAGVEEEEARTKRIIRQPSNTGGEKVEEV